MRWPGCGAGCFVFVRLLVGGVETQSPTQRCPILWFWGASSFVVGRTEAAQSVATGLKLHPEGSPKIVRLRVADLLAHSSQTCTHANPVLPIFGCPGYFCKAPCAFFLSSRRIRHNRGVGQRFAALAGASPPAREATWNRLPREEPAGWEGAGGNSAVPNFPAPVRGSGFVMRGLHRGHEPGWRKSRLSTPKGPTLTIKLHESNDLRDPELNHPTGGFLSGNPQIHSMSHSLLITPAS